MAANPDNVTETGSDTLTNVTEQTEQTRTTGVTTQLNKPMRIERPVFIPPVLRRFPVSRPVPKKQTPGVSRANSRIGKRKENQKIAQRTPTPFPRIITKTANTQADGDGESSKSPFTSSSATATPQPQQQKENQKPGLNDTSIGGIVGGAYGPTPDHTREDSSVQSEDIFHTADLPEMGSKHNTPSSEQQKEPAQAKENGSPQEKPRPADVTSPDDYADFNPPLTSSPKDSTKSDSPVVAKADPKQPTKASKKAVFADEHKAPLATDNEGQAWRRSKSYVDSKPKEEQKVPRHVPFDMSSEISESSGQKGKKDSKTKSKQSPEFQQLVTTRTGRMVRQPDRLGIQNPQNDVQQPVETRSKGKRKPGYDIVSRSPSPSPSTSKHTRKKDKRRLDVFSSDDEQMFEQHHQTHPIGMDTDDDTNQGRRVSKPPRQSTSRQMRQTQSAKAQSKPESSHKSQQEVKGQGGQIDPPVPSPVQMTNEMDVSSPEIARPVAQMDQGYFDPSIAGKRYVSQKPIVHTWTAPEQGVLRPVPVLGPDQDDEQPNQQQMPVLHTPQLQNVSPPSVLMPQQPVHQVPVVPQPMGVGMIIRPYAPQMPQQVNQLWVPPVSPRRTRNTQPARPRSVRDIPINELLDSMDVIRVPRNLQEQDMPIPGSQLIPRLGFDNQQPMMQPQPVMMNMPQMGDIPQQQTPMQMQMPIPMPMPIVQQRPQMPLIVVSQPQPQVSPMPAHMVQGTQQQQPMDLRTSGFQNVSPNSQPQQPNRIVVTTTSQQMQMPSSSVLYVPAGFQLIQNHQPVPVTMSSTTRHLPAIPELGQPSPMQTVQQLSPISNQTNVPQQSVTILGGLQGVRYIPDQSHVKQQVITTPTAPLILGKRQSAEPAGDQTVNILNQRRTITEPPTQIPRIDVPVVPQVPQDGQKPTLDPPSPPQTQGSDVVQPPSIVASSQPSLDTPSQVPRKRPSTTPAGDDRPNILNPRRSVVEPPSQQRRIDSEPEVSTKIDQTKPSISEQKTTPQKIDSTESKPKEQDKSSKEVKAKKRPSTAPVADEPNILNPGRAVLAPDTKMPKIQKDTSASSQPVGSTKQPSSIIPLARTETNPLPGPSGTQTANQQEQDRQDQIQDGIDQLMAQPDLLDHDKVAQYEQQLRSLLAQRMSPAQKKTDYNPWTDSDEDGEDGNNTDGEGDDTDPTRRTNNNTPVPQPTSEADDSDHGGNGNNDQHSLDGGNDDNNDADNDHSSQESGASDHGSDHSNSDQDSPVPGTSGNISPTRRTRALKRPATKDFTQQTSASDYTTTSTDTDQEDQPLVVTPRRSGRVRRQPDRLKYEPKPPKSKKKAKPKPRRSKMSPKQEMRGTKRVMDQHLTDSGDQQSDNQQSNESDTDHDQQDVLSDDDNDMGQQQPLPVRRSARMRQSPDRYQSEDFRKPTTAPKKKKK